MGGGRVVDAGKYCRMAPPKRAGACAAKCATKDSQLKRTECAFGCGYWQNETTTASGGVGRSAGAVAAALPTCAFVKASATSRLVRDVRHYPGQAQGHYVCEAAAGQPQRGLFLFMPGALEC